MIEWESIGIEKQVAFYLGLSEIVIKLLNKSEFFEDARKALDVCWEWFETKQISGDDIYSLLDDGTEYNGLFMKMQMDEDETNEAKWDCLIDAISFVNKQAYLYEKELYLPAPIENVDDDLINHFLACFYSIDKENQKLASDFFDYLKKSEITNKSDVERFFA
jgi:hypothetical protein